VGSRFSRNYDVDVAESCTQNGVWLLRLTIRAARERGWSVVYADTDSLFVVGCTREEFQAFVAWCNAELYPPVLAKFGCPENAIKLEFEKSFDRLVFTSAKRYCNPPEAPIWMGDLSFKPLGEVRVGDEVVGWLDGERVSPNKKRVLHRARVVAVHQHVAPIVRVTFASGRVLRCTADHRWLHVRRSTKDKSQFVTPKVGRELAHVVDPTPPLSDALVRDAAWLGGMFDGEGSLCSGGRGQIVISQSERVNPEVCARLEATLNRLGFDFHKWAQRSGNCNTFALRGSRQGRVNFVNWCRPAKL
jgi:hypothetical protein